MASKTIQITKYNYTFEPRGAAVLQLWAGQASVLQINFVDDNASLPPPALTADLSSATVTFRRSVLAGLVDMLRNESPVYVTLNNQPPGFVFVKTFPEGVGEGEAVQ